MGKIVPRPRGGVVVDDQSPGPPNRKQKVPSLKASYTARAWNSMHVYGAYCSCCIWCFSTPKKVLLYPYIVHLWCDEFRSDMHVLLYKNSIFVILARFLPQGTPWTPHKRSMSIGTLVNWNKHQYTCTTAKNSQWTYFPGYKRCFSFCHRQPDLKITDILAHAAKKLCPCGQQFIVSCLHEG